jgi:hypothetical protein
MFFKKEPQGTTGIRWDKNGRGKSESFNGHPPLKLRRVRVSRESRTREKDGIASPSA